VSGLSGRPGVAQLSPPGDLGAYCTRVPLQPGLAATVVLEVTEVDTALAMRSGQVPVLATPRLIALCEEAAMRAVAGEMPEGTTNVGMRVQLDHLAPTAVGNKVTAEATLEKVEGRRLTFTVSATDERGLIAAGKVTRVVVDIERFLDKCT
jgi:fluoroacetyl-CoA thioesterase